MHIDDRKVIEKLDRAHDAGYLSEKHRRCLPGTREKILLDLEAWAHDPSALSVYWLNGHAGSGKSTIAQSFCDQASTGDALLGASFFCSRDTEARSNLDMIFPTLCFQLASRFPKIRSLVAETLRNHPDVAKESLNNQIEALLIIPLEQSSLRTLIVIDALDECKDTEPESIILYLLSQKIRRIPQVKWFITGRPEPVIRRGFRIRDLRPITEMFVLHNVAASDVDDDIYLYIDTCLFEGVKQRSNLHLPEIWPPVDEIRALTMKCEQLFIFASTAVKYILSFLHDPAERLSNFCRSESSTPEHGRLGLDRLYANVLKAGYDDASSDDHESLKVIIASVLLAVNPIPVGELAVLLNVKVTSIMGLLSVLHAVLRVPQSHDRPISLYHKSFFDYITNASRCTDPKYYVDPPTQHCMLVNSCLKLMNLRLKRNPCSLPRYAMNTDLNLEKRRRRIGGALEYACTSWVAHLSLSKISSHTLKLLEAFLKKHFIHWMEVMSLIDKFPFVIKQLHEVHNSLTAMTNTSNTEEIVITELLRWIYDGRKLASEFREPVQISASHLYHSALPLAPEESLLADFYSKFLDAEAKIMHGKAARWPLADMSIPCQASSALGVTIKFSHNGKFLATVETIFDDSKILIYDITTGEHLHTFPGKGVCFAPDDTQIAVATGIRSMVICDLRTGTQHAINPHDKAARITPTCNQAFSPSGQLLATGEKNSLVIWNISSGQQEREIDINFPLSQLMWLEEDPPSFITLQNSHNSVQVTEVTINSSNIIFQCPGGALHYLMNSFFSLSLKQGLIAIVHNDNLYLVNLELRQLLSQLPLPSSDLAMSLFEFSLLQPHILWGKQFFNISDPTQPKRMPINEDFQKFQWIAFSPTQYALIGYRSERLHMISIMGSHFFLPTDSPGQSDPSMEAGELYSYNKLFISSGSDTTQVVLIREGYDTTTATGTTIHIEKNGAIKTVVDIIVRKDEHSTFQSMSPILSTALQQVCLYSKANGFFRMEASGFSEMKAFGLDAGWLDFISLQRKSDYTGHFCFANLHKHTLVFVTYMIVQPLRLQLRINVIVYSLVKERIVAQIEFPPGYVLWDFYTDVGWINVDDSTGIFTMFCPRDISGAWSFVNAPDKTVNTGKGLVPQQHSDTSSHTLVLIPSDLNMLMQLNSHLRVHYSDHSLPVEYPVLVSKDREWIMNYIGQHIFWLPYRVRPQFSNFHQNWRWCCKRLIVAANRGDYKSPDPLIVDFMGVDAQVPTVLQVFEKLGWGKIVISGLARLEEEDN